jgi:membrane protease YdiL (CAAX protease family)
MFTKYFRVYPWWLQLILFILMIFVMFWLSVAIVLFIIPKATGVPQTALTDLSGLNENSPRALINAAMLFQLITSIGIFLVPALLFAYLAHPRPAGYLGLRAPGKPIHWLLVIFLFLGAMPVFLTLENWISHINFGPGVRASQAVNDHIMNAFLTMPSLSAFYKAFLIMAIVPAVGEEMFFRGILMRFVKKRSYNMTIPIICSALIFTFAHANIYGFLSIFLAGVLLAVIYYLTGSLLCSMLGHLLNNGLQIIAVYLAATHPAIKAMMDSNSLPAYVPVIGIAVFAISFYFLWKTKTPLPPDWANDYTAKELSENAY